MEILRQMEKLRAEYQVQGIEPIGWTLGPMEYVIFITATQLEFETGPGVYITAYQGLPVRTVTTPGLGVELTSKDSLRRAAEAEMKRLMSPRCRICGKIIEGVHACSGLKLDHLKY